MAHDRNVTVNWRDISMKEILELAITDEEDACEYYKHAAELAGTPHTREMLLKLSEMERGHAETLRKELEELEWQRQLEAGLAD